MKDERKKESNRDRQDEQGKEEEIRNSVSNAFAFHPRFNSYPC
jgi:hypothetical protein